MRTRIFFHGAAFLAVLAAVGCDQAPLIVDDGGPPDDGGIDPPDAPITPDGGPEATTFTVRVENVAPFTNAKTGTFAMRTDGSGAGPIAPGGAYEFSFTAGPRHRLAFAAMFGQSNDWFFAPAADGIALYDEGTPISGDVTDQVLLWDAGTEVNEEPAVGPHTGPRQSTSTDGPGAPDPDANVRVVPETVTLTDGTSFERPAVSDMIRVTIDSDEETRTFTVRIENVSDDSSTLQTSEGAKPVRVSPGVWALGDGGDPIFSDGAPDRGEGLEAIAEMGQIADLSAALAAQSGVATPISPGVFVVHTTAGPLFTVGEPDRGLGLENIAERGDISVLSDSLAAELPDGASAYGTYAIAVGATDPGAIRSGGAYEFEVTARPGDRLSFAMMYGASNDWAFATVEEGIALFDGDAPRSGDVSADVRIFDVGTELSEEPGVGPHVGAPEGALDTDTNVREVPESEYATPAQEHVRVTLAH